MTLQGCPTLVTSKNLDDPSQSSRYTEGVFLELKERNGRLKLSIRLKENGDIIQTLGGYYLDDCTYVEESSMDDVIICFSHNETKEVVTITDKNKKCGRLFDKMVECFENNQRTRNPSPSPRRRSPSPRPKPRSPEKDMNETARRLIKALNGNKGDDAANYAQELAEKKYKIQLGLEVKNEPSNQSAKENEDTTAKLLKLKVCIESYASDENDNKTYEVFIVPSTTVRNLKETIQKKTSIRAEQQYWFVNQEVLDDTYEFKENDHKIQENTVINLYISS